MTNISSIKEIPTAPSILIILMGSLGDVARGLGLVSHIKAHRPESRITWLVEPKCADLVGLHPQIDHVIRFRRKRSVAAIWDLYQKLQKEDFDITLDLQRHLKSGFFSLLSRGQRRIGFHRKNAKEFNWLFNNESIACCDENLPKLGHYLKFTEHLGLPQPHRLDFGLETLDVNKLIPPAVAAIQNSFIAVVMGSSWESKDWTFEGYANLVQHIIKNQNRHVVLLGGSDQWTVAEKHMEKANSPHIINLTGNSLIEMTAVLKAAAAAVGPDSGPGHLAAAVGTPYVTLFGPTPANRHVPYGCEHLLVQSDLDCAPCYRKQCPQGNNRCMENIIVDDVTQKISRALEEIAR
ncbi:MAG: glycosyltransferase family 9 protein [Desulfobacteraceae bacterium]|jgi:ADP-heptose:LPS heptosyltransferase|nr:glycosyltransferase family 9 protein [Desulfobacteraceae bacterium]